MQGRSKGINIIHIGNNKNKSYLNFNGGFYLMGNNKFEEEKKFVEELRTKYESIKFEDKEPSERRLYTRYKAEIPVCFQDKKTEVSALTLDIGGGGLRFSHQEALDPEQDYEFKIFLDKIDYPITIAGRMVWQKYIPDNDKYEIGIFFSKISDGDRMKLQNILSNNYQTDLPPGAERRKFLRVPKLLFATIEMGDELKEIFSGLIVDISMAGIRLLSSRQIPKDAVLALNIELEEGTILRLKGQVVWGNHVDALKKFQHGIEFVYGIEFDTASSAIKTIIDEYVDFRKNEEEANLVHTILRLGKEGKLPA